MTKLIVYLFFNRVQLRTRSSSPPHSSCHPTWLINVCRYIYTYTRTHKCQAHSIVCEPSLHDCYRRASIAQNRWPYWPSFGELYCFNFVFGEGRKLIAIYNTHCSKFQSLDFNDLRTECLLTTWRSWVFILQGPNIINCLFSFQNIAFTLCTYLTLIWWLGRKRHPTFWRAIN